MLGPRRWLYAQVPLFAGAMLAFFAALPTARPVGADETVPATGTRAAAEGVLVLRSGVVVSGKIVRSGDQYEVQSPAGTMAVPESLVKLHAPNLGEAYARLRASAEAQSGANGRITLAQWCLTNHLEKEACQELRDALALEPDRDDAKRLLRNAEEALEARGKPAKITTPAADPVRASRLTGGTTEDPGSLGGLSREQGLQFARRIQPLLINNCTAAGCHGRDSETGFRLSKVTPGKDASRHAAERNLAEILEEIDVKKPRSSPLLTAPRGNHGRRGRPIFVGPRGDEQLAELARWVTAVAAEETQREKRGQPGGTAKNSVEQVASRNDGGLPRDKSAAATRDPFTAAAGAGAVAKQPAQSPIVRDQVDPFDPANFNRITDRRTGR
jgi:hypothetical protein